MAVQPGSREIWVSNTEAFNFIPYEPRLKSKFTENRITRIFPSTGGARQIQSVNLNPPISIIPLPQVRSQNENSSLAQPLDLLFQPDGKEAYVAAFGSRKIGVLDVAGHVVDRIAVGFGLGPEVWLWMLNINVSMSSIISMRPCPLSI